MTGARADDAGRDDTPAAGDATPAAVSVLIPVWDEAAAVGGVVAGALASCAASGLSAEVVVCVDGRTTDGSGEAAAAAGARVVPQQGRGLTAAVLAAAAVASAPTCVVVDGDGQHDPARIPDLLAPILEGRADLVCGARSPAGLHTGYGRGPTARLRRLATTLLGRLARAATGTEAPDPLTGMFACATAQLARVAEHPRTCPPGGYKLLLPLLAATPAERTAHSPIGFEPRRGGSSHMGARTALTLCRQLAHLAAARRR